MVIFHSYLSHYQREKYGNIIDMDWIQDSHYRNQFETNTSGGLLKTSAREKWERGAHPWALGLGLGFETEAVKDLSESSCVVSCEKCV